MPNTPPTAGGKTGTGRVVRIQRSRAKGWRMPPGALYVGRPTRFGNPFTVADALADDPALTEASARERCASLFGLWLTGEIHLTSPAFAERRAWILGHVGELAGRDLVCWCPIGPCHADVLIEMAMRGGNDG